MRKTIFGCLGAAAVSLALQFTTANVHASLFSTCNPCDEVGVCDPCGPCGDNDSCNPCDAACGTKAGKWFLNGHMESGFFANGHGNTATYTGGEKFIAGRPYDTISGNTGLLQNTRLTGAQINQTYLSMGKKVDGRHGLDIGGTVDFTWGSDAYIVQSKGLEYAAGHGLGDQGRWGTGDYYAAFAQAYTEIAYGRWDVIVGKFAAPFGSSSYKSTDNFFYSWATTNIIAPHTAAGAYTTYKVSDRLSVIGGWAMPEEFGESSKHNDVLGGIVWTPSNRLSARYVFAAGENKYVAGSPEEFVHTLLTTYHISKKLRYVFDWTYINVKAAGDNKSAYGLNNEVIYQLNKKWSFGTRFGMLHAGEYVGTYVIDSSATNAAALVNGMELYTIGVGANWTPTKWLIVKPEVRYDWTKDHKTAFNSGANSYQTSGGVSAVVKF